MDFTELVRKRRAIAELCSEKSYIEADVTPVGIIPIGFAAEDKRSPSLKRGRKSWENVVHWGGWDANQ